MNLIRVGRAVLVAVLLPWQSIGCSAAACDVNNRVAERYLRGVVVDGVYVSSPWNGPLVRFSGGRAVGFEHHLGYTPLTVAVYLAFREDGVPETPEEAAETGMSMAPCAGNSCEILMINEEMVVVQNATCAEFWVRVVAFGNPGAGGGTADGGQSVDGGSS